MSAVDDRYNHSAKGLARNKRYASTAKARARQKRYRSTAAYREHDKFRQLGYRTTRKLRENAL